MKDEMVVAAIEPHFHDYQKGSIESAEFLARAAQAAIASIRKDDLASRMADEIEGLIPFLEQHHCKVVPLAEMVAEARSGVRKDDELRDALSDDECAICGRKRYQHTTNSGVGMCQIYPIFRSKREFFAKLAEESRTALSSVAGDG